MSDDWLIMNAEPVNEGRRFHAGPHVNRGCVGRIAGDPDARTGKRVVGAIGLRLPGMIDGNGMFSSFLSGHCEQDGPMVDESARGQQLAFNR